MYYYVWCPVFWSHLLLIRLQILMLPSTPLPLWKGLAPIPMSEVPTWVLIGLKIGHEHVTWHRPRFPGVQTKLISDQRKLFKPSRTACLRQIHSCPVTLCGLVRFLFLSSHNWGPPPWWPWPITQNSGVSTVNNKLSIDLPTWDCEKTAVEDSIYLPLIYTFSTVFLLGSPMLVSPNQFVASRKNWLGSTNCFLVPPTNHPNSLCVIP